MKFIIISMMLWTAIILTLIGMTSFMQGCGEIKETEDFIEQIDEVSGGTNHPAPTQTIEATPTPFIPENCSNPPKEISYHDGFKCKASETRGGSIVCLLPWQFTWQPRFIDSDGTISSMRYFDEVYLVLNNGNQIDLKFAGFHNPVYLQQGKINRQHFRNESRQWNDIKNRVSHIVMMKGNKATCLRF